MDLLGNIPKRLRPILVVLAPLLACTHAIGDAIIRTQAMFASTIAEYFVEDDRVIVDLEIGLADLPAFRNLIPDSVYQGMGYSPRPLRERLSIFFEQEFVITNEVGERLRGRIIEMAPRERVLRDEITGEPQPGEQGDKETVIYARLEYPFSEKPENLTFANTWSDSLPAIGFIVYHKTIPVNDFRYLAASQTLDLDWQDPWYTSFRTRNLRRAFFSPMSGFIYVEPYEVRKEIIVRPKDLQYWLDLSLEDRETIPVEMQDELKRKVAEFLRQHHKVTIDGEEIVPELARIHFLERTLKSSRVVDPPAELDINSAILGAIFVYPTVKPLPQKVEMDWDLFNDRIQLIPAASVDQAGPLPVRLEPDFAVLEWQNFLKNPKLPTLTDLTPPPSTLSQTMLYLRWLLLVATVGVLVWSWQELRHIHRHLGAKAAVALFMLAATGASMWLAHQARLPDAKTQSVVSGLLHNIYRAFDFREEEKIYDVLEQSVDGDLLTEIYLQTRRGLELANQGGARAKVKEIALVDFVTRTGQNGGFVADATWNVLGSVGHWGHVHQRVNQYRAVLDIQPVNGVWKLVDLDILEEERL